MEIVTIVDEMTIEDPKVLRMRRTGARGRNIITESTEIDRSVRTSRILQKIMTARKLATAEAIVTEKKDPMMPLDTTVTGNRRGTRTVIIRLTSNSGPYHQVTKKMAALARSS
jgi:hypothetical protein